MVAVRMMVGSVESMLQKLVLGSSADWQGVGMDDCEVIEEFDEERRLMMTAMMMLWT